MSEDNIQRQQLEWAQFSNQAVAWLDERGQITEQTQAWGALVGERLAQATSATLRLHQAEPGKRWYAASPRTGRALALAAFSSAPGLMLMAKLAEDETLRSTPHAITTATLEEQTSSVTDEARAQIERLQHELMHLQDELKSTRHTQGSFLASMSHELRTPLNAIIGYSELVLEEAEELDEPHLCEDLRRILGSAQSLLRLINNILDLSLIESNRINLQWDRVDLSEALAGELAMARQLAEQQNNLFTFKLDPQIGPMWLDRARLKQVLYHLLSNAAKFTTGGAFSLEVERVQPPDQEPRIEFRVHDTGMGIPKDRQDTIFEAFSQADNSTTRAYGGAGLGLALARHFSRMMGGDISLESEPSQGSTFTVWLPLHELPELAQPHEAFAAKAQDPDTQSYARLLIIDDDPQVHKSITQLLSDEPVVISSAFNGMDGLLMARQLNPNMITLDVLMPGLNGWTVLSTLKNDPQLAQIPVIILSMLNDRNMGFALGASDFLTKPIDRKRLQETLARYRTEDGEGLVLLIDDEPNLRDLMRRRIEAQDWRVCEAPDGQIALELLDRERPDLIILDLMMPNMDGFEFLERLRQRPEHADTPVIVLTALSLNQSALDRLRGHVEQVLQKSARTGDELLEALKAQLKKSRPLK